MQTFLPYPSFKESARVLDNRRLGKQRVECKQILRAIQGKTAGWINHPAVKMWAGHEGSLCEYALAICDEWIARGFNDTIREWFIEEDIEPCNAPVWLNDPGFHASHRSNLLRKDPEHYGKFGWVENPDIPYIWPV